MTETLFGLPVKVRFCTKCVISNQRPRSTVEFQNSILNKKETIEFDSHGVCEACRFHEIKETGINSFLDNSFAQQVNSETPEFIQNSPKSFKELQLIFPLFKKSTIIFIFVSIFVSIAVSIKYIRFSYFIFNI